MCTRQQISKRINNQKDGTTEVVWIAGVRTCSGDTCDCQVIMLGEERM